MIIVRTGGNELYSDPNPRQRAPVTCDLYILHYLTDDLVAIRATVPTRTDTLDQALEQAKRAIQEGRLPVLIERDDGPPLNRYEIGNRLGLAHSHRLFWTA
jgi:hypothetical protein